MESIETVQNANHYWLVLLRDADAYPLGHTQPRAVRDGDFMTIRRIEIFSELIWTGDVRTSSDENNTER